jgi:hypothetical protein
MGNNSNSKRCQSTQFSLCSHSAWTIRGAERQAKSPSSPKFYTLLMNLPRPLFLKKHWSNHKKKTFFSSRTMHNMYMYIVCPSCIATPVCDPRPLMADMGEFYSSLKEKDLFDATTLGFVKHLQTELAKNRRARTYSF